MKTVPRSDAGVSGQWSATVLGLGNIGAFVAGLLARLLDLVHLTILDRDAYDETNVVSQDIVAADVGEPKALVQAERLRRINPQLRVEALVDDLEFVPMGLLRADVLLACLDSRRARQVVNQLAWRLGIPWIDAGVRADGSLVRVNVYVPGYDRPCWECPLDDLDYAAIETIYPCQGEAPAPRATNAPASLGALAAAVQVVECEKLLTGRIERALIGKQVIIDAAAHRHFVTSFRRNPVCRFDHATWAIDRLPQQPSKLRVGDAFALARGAGAALRVEGQAFVRQLTCPRCGEARALHWRLSGRLGPERQCPRCQRRMVAAGFDVVEWLREGDLPPGWDDRPLCDLGLRTADVVTVRAGDAERHVQLGMGPAQSRVRTCAEGEAPACQVQE